MDPVSIGVMLGIQGAKALAGSLSQPPPPPPRPLYRLNTEPNAQFSQDISSALDPLAAQTSANVKNFLNTAPGDFTPAAAQSTVPLAKDWANSHYGAVANMIPTAINEATKRALLNKKTLSDTAMQRSIDLQNAQINNQNQLENWYYVHNRPNPFLGFMQGVAGALPDIIGAGGAAAGIGGAAAGAGGAAGAAAGLL